MTHRLPPVHWLQAFDAAARHMSFTEAARELNLTQSAVSQRIKLLEHRLGQPLFVRHPRSLELSEAGRAFAPSVRESFERLGLATEEMFGPGEGEPCTVRSTPGFMLFWLSPRLHRFRALHGDITLRLTSSVWASEFTLEGVDLEIRYGFGDWPEVASRRLTWERVFPVCSPAVAARLQTPADLARETLLHVFGFETGWPHWLAHAGAPDVTDTARAVLCDTSVVVMDLARRGEGVALLRNSFTEDALTGGELCVPFTPVIDLNEAFYLAEPLKRTLRPEVAAFRDWIVSEVGAGE
jgi:LysR family glycine cleavage system transcriptional activator